MRGLAIVLLLACGLGAGPALAQVPSTMSYQGVLTDAGGNVVPDGPYGLTFRIYDVASGGVALWTESWAGVTVSKGGFSVLLGSSVPLSLAFDKPYWLGVTVGALAELTPRVPLAASPYGLALRLPFAGTSADSDHTLKISNTGSGVAILADPSLVLGSTSSTGYLDWWGTGSSYPYGNVGSYAGLGGYTLVSDENGTAYSYLEPDFTGEGAFWDLEGAGGSYVYFSSEQSAGQGALVLHGQEHEMSFNMGVTGNRSVELPASAISAYETLDEPGVSQGKVNGSIGVSSTNYLSMDNVISTTITIPAPGYIEVEISAQAGIAGLTGSNLIAFQIDEIGAGAARDTYHYYYIGGDMPSTGNWYFPVSNRRTYYKALAGTYSFYFTASKTAGSSNYFFNPTITATYVPTGYGTVTEAPEVLAGAEATEGQQGMTAPGPTVDLRELELQVARTELAAEQAQRQLTVARRQEQAKQRAALTPAAAKKQ